MPENNYKERAEGRLATSEDILDRGGVGAEVYALQAQAFATLYLAQVQDTANQLRAAEIAISNPALLPTLTRLGLI